SELFYPSHPHAHTLSGFLVCIIRRGRLPDIIQGIYSPSSWLVNRLLFFSYPSNSSFNYFVIKQIVKIISLFDGYVWAYGCLINILVPVSHIMGCKVKSQIGGKMKIIV